MPNHFHLMVFVKPTDDNSIGNKSKNLNNAIATLLRSYTRALQKQESFTGSLFQQKTKAKELIDSFNLTMNLTSICAHYIHQNQIKAGLVAENNAWEFSSYPDYLSIRNGTLCNKKIFYLIAAIESELFISESKHLIEEKINAKFF